MGTRRAALAGALILPFAPALAQDAAPFSFGLSQRLEVTDNLGLDVESEGTTVLATTVLSFGLRDETARQSLALTADMLLRIEDGPGANDPQVEGPRLALTYGREAATVALSLGARYSVDEITFLRTLDDFPEGLPDDFEDLEGTGTRISSGVDARLELGREGPFGATLTLGADTITYDAAAASLEDRLRLQAGLALRLRVSPVADATANLSTSYFEDDDTERRTTTASLGLGYDLSPRTRLDTSLGYSVIDTDETDQSTARTDGLNASVAIAHDVPDGTVTGRLTALTTTSGTRTSLLLGRSLALPRSQVAASIGASLSEDGDPALIGTLSWRQDLPNGTFDTQLSRSVVFSDDEDADLLRTSLSTSYNTRINEISSAGLSATYTFSDGSGTGSTVETATLGMRYSRALTQDWDLTLAYGLRLREEDDAGQATSNTVSMTVGRAFVARR